VVAVPSPSNGVGRTKKEAEQKAAQLAWRSLSDGDDEGRSDSSGGSDGSDEPTA
jgi:ribonuclease III